MRRMGMSGMSEMRTGEVPSQRYRSTTAFFPRARASVRSSTPLPRR